jgi:hypothetical protein
LEHAGSSFLTEAACRGEPQRLTLTACQFCASCGPIEERKLATILVTDIVGSSAKS